MLVSEIKDDCDDSAGTQIVDVYARQPPHYAVYRTDQRVMVHFADKPEEAREQSGRLAPLNPVRGEINGLIDGWRSKANERAKAKARRYDRRIADALVLALEGDADSGVKVLAGIKSDIIDERTSWARFEYLLASFAMATAMILLVWLILVWVTPTTPMAWLLWFSLAGGTIGAFFSIAITIRKRTVLTDLHTRDNIADAALRVVVGAIAAALLVSLVNLHAVNLTLGSIPVSGDISKDWLYLLVVAFVAGFSEQLIPDLLEKSAVVAGAPPAAVPPAGARQPAPATAGATQPTQATATDTGKLHEIRGDLEAGRQIIGALQKLGVGSPILAGADALAGTADAVLGDIDKVLQGGAGAPNAAGIAGVATQLLGQLDNAGLPGVLGGATSVLSSVMKVAEPAIAGLPGGPVGVVAGLVMGGLQVLSDERKFNAWKAALLAKPFDRALLPPSVEGDTALVALELSPLMSKRLEGTPPNIATELLRACVTPGADGNPKNSSDLAQELLGDADPLGLRGHFASAAELTEALEEYRASAIFIRARDELAGQIAIPALAGAPASSMDAGTLLTTAFKLRQDPRAGDALEKIVFLVQALGGLHMDPGKLTSLVVSGLEAGAAMIGNSRTVEDPHNARS